MGGHILSVFTNKGGTGKTTTAVSLGQALAREGKKVLVVDNDSQCNATTLLIGRELQSENQSLYNLYEKRWPDITPFIQFMNFQENLCCIPNYESTASLEPLLLRKGRENGVFTILRENLRRYALNRFDITIIDNPPNHGLFVINSLIASDFAIIPTSAGSMHSIHGLVKALSLINDIMEEDNPDLKFLRLLLTKVDRRKSAHRINIARIQEHFGPNNQIFETVVPENTEIEKAELRNLTLFRHNAKSYAAKAYRGLAREVMSILDI